MNAATRRRHPLRFLTLPALALVLGAAGGAVHQRARQVERSPSSDSAAVISVVTRFHDALARGDTSTALSLLSPHVVILESGGSETLAQYRSHHLAADARFARDVRTVRAPLTARVVGDVAWVYGTSRSEGTFRGRSVRTAGAELVVLVRRAPGWVIAAVHWSGRALPRHPVAP